MKGLSLVTQAMRMEPVSRIPWVPFVGAHAGSLLGMTATEFLSSADNIVAGVNKAIELYQPDGIPVMFDLQVEAEALGCDLAWADDNPPAVVSHPLSQGATLSDLKVPCPCKGRIPVAMGQAGVPRRIIDAKSVALWHGRRGRGRVQALIRARQRGRLYLLTITLG